MHDRKLVNTGGMNKNVLTGTVQGGALTENGVQVCVALKTPFPPFHTLLAICKTHISAFFSSQDSTFTPNHKFLDFKLQSPKIGKKSSVSKPQTGLK